MNRKFEQAATLEKWKCPACSKPVYEIERIVASDGRYRFNLK
jgi:hypothetical protein